jgi:hypothetical protein
MAREARKAAYAALPKGQVDAVAAMSPPCRTVAIWAAMYPDIRRFLNSTAFEQSRWRGGRYA